jgi:redox-sensitive bicupin YhaK (pirin superfamily)
MRRRRSRTFRRPRCRVSIIDGVRIVVAVGHAFGGQAPRTPATIMLVGGAKLDGARIIWWNFVASSRERSYAAKAKWRAQEFGRISGETEFIPLLER